MIDWLLGSMEAHRGQWLGGMIVLLSFAMWLEELARAKLKRALKGARDATES